MYWLQINPYNHLYIYKIEWSIKKWLVLHYDNSYVLDFPININNLFRFWHFVILEYLCTQILVVGIIIHIFFIFRFSLTSLPTEARSLIEYDTPEISKDGGKLSIKIVTKQPKEWKSDVLVELYFNTLGWLIFHLFWDLNLYEIIF